MTELREATKSPHGLVRFASESATLARGSAGQIWRTVTELACAVVTPRRGGSDVTSRQRPVD
jgi:hypothetical protein